MLETKIEIDYNKRLVAGLPFVFCKKATIESR